MRKKPVNVENFDLDKAKDKIADLPGLIAFPHTIGSALIKPEDMGRAKGKAVAAMQEQTEAQMMQLYEQMQTLAQQASDIKKRIAISIRIYQSKMNFDPVMGHVYYLYHKKDGSDYLSMISPTEWGGKMPYEACLATVKLLSDHTWHILEGSVDESS